MNRRIAISFVKSILLVLVLSTMVAVFSCRHAQVAANKWHLQPPIPSLDLPFTEFALDVEKGGEFNLASGTTIIVPAGALLDSKGNPVVGKATLRYREFQRSPEIFLSGIPMAYTDSGEYKVMQTAGMFEMRAVQDGAELKIADNKGIIVNLASSTGADGYNTFALDESTGKWQVTGDSKAEKSERKALLLKDKMKLQQQAEELRKKGYFVPNYAALLDAVYGPKVAEQGRYNKTIRNKVDRYGIEYANFSGMQTINYKGTFEIAEVMLWKNLSGKNLPKLNSKRYFFANYVPVKDEQYMMHIMDQDGKKLFSGLVKAEIPLRKLFKIKPDDWNHDYETVMKSVDSVYQVYQKMEAFTRAVMVGTFGVTNCDAFTNRTDRVDVAASVDFDVEPNADAKQGMSLYYLGADKKTVVTFSLNSLDGHYKIFLLPDTNACLLSLYPDGHAAVLSRQDFKKLKLEELQKPGADAARVFHLKRTEKPFTTAKDISNLVGS